MKLLMKTNGNLFKKFDCFNIVKRIIMDIDWKEEDTFFIHTDEHFDEILEF
jgi:hypothetical protein